MMKLRKARVRVALTGATPTAAIARYFEYFVVVVVVVVVVVDDDVDDVTRTADADAAILAPYFQSYSIWTACACKMHICSFCVHTSPWACNILLELSIQERPFKTT